MEQTLQLNGEPIPKLSKGKRIGLILILLSVAYISSNIVGSYYPLDINKTITRSLNFEKAITDAGLEDMYSNVMAETLTKEIIDTKVLYSLVAFVILILLWRFFSKHSVNKAIAQKESINIAFLAMALPYLFQLIILPILFGTKDIISNPQNIDIYYNIFYKPLCMLFYVCTIAKIYAISLLINNNKHAIDNKDMTWIIFVLIQVPIFTIIAIIKLVNSELVTTNHSGKNHKIDYSPINKYAIGGILYYILTLICVNNLL